MTISQRSTFDVHKKSGLNRQSKGENNMLNSCLAFMVLVMLGCFAAGSSEIVAERAERKRVEGDLKRKHPPVY